MARTYREAQLAARAAAGSLSADAVRRVEREIRRYAERVAAQVAGLPVGTPYQRRLALERTHAIMLESADGLNTALQQAIAGRRRTAFRDVLGIWQAAGLQVANTAGVPNALLGTVKAPPITLLGAYESLGGGAATWKTRLTSHVKASAEDLDGIVRTALMEGVHPEELAKRLRPYVAGAEAFHRAFPRQDEAFARLHDLRGLKGAELRDAARKLQANARRIAYTETHNARREAELQHFAVDPLVEGVIWRLAPMRGNVDVPDECDAFAKVIWYEGMPPGWHRLDAVPVPPHPHDRCEVVPFRRPVEEAAQPKRMPPRTVDPERLTIPGHYLGFTEKELAAIRTRVAANFGSVEQAAVGQRMRQLMASSRTAGRELVPPAARGAPRPRPSAPARPPAAPPPPRLAPPPPPPRRSPAELRQRLAAGHLTVADFQNVPFEEAENLIRREPIEHAIAYRGGQPVLYKSTGRRDEVSFTTAEVLQVADATFTHNHPRSLPFSPDDGMFTLAANLVEMRAAARDGTFVLRRAESGFLSRDEQGFWQDYRRILAEELAALPPHVVRLEIDRGLITPEGAERRLAERVWRRLGALYGFTYEFEELGEEGA